MASAVGGSPQPSSEDGARMSEEWLRKEKGRKTQHLKHNREQAVLRLVGWETMGGPRGGCCISSKLARSQNSCRFRDDTSLVFTLGVTLTFHLSTSVFIKCGPSRPGGKYLMAVVNEYSSLASLIPFGGLCFPIVSEGFCQS